MLNDFIVDKTTKTVFFNREFAAPLSLVWDAFNTPELLDQWTAPKPWTAKMKFMNFEVGGRRFYAMVSPEGEDHWSVQKYTAISPKTNFKMSNALADKDENPELPGSDWDFNLSEQDGTTTVSISIYNESLERMEKVLEMSFRRVCVDNEELGRYADNFIAGGKNGGICRNGKRNLLEQQI